MNKKAGMLIIILMCICQLINAQNNKLSNHIYLSDPTIYLVGGTYYLYGTQSGGFDSTHTGFPVYFSFDLKNWEGPHGADGGYAMHKDKVFGDKGFWAPQLFEYKDLYYMAYTANERIAIATADCPLGAFESAEKKEMKAPVKQIDPFIFFDDDGKIYMYHVRLSKGNRIFVAEMNEDLKSIKPETVKECISVEEAWEDTSKAKWPVVEGPTVEKRKGIYYLFYSANPFTSKDYSVGYATSTSPFGPWKKSKDSPIIHRSQLGEFGTGHGDLFKDMEGNYHYVFHTHYSEKKVRPRKTAIVDVKFVDEGEGKPAKVIVDTESFRFLELKND